MRKIAQWASAAVIAGLMAPAVCTAQTRAATFVVPQPKVTLIPITADSYPWLYHKYTQRPLPLEKFGFVEEEYLVSGTANVYDWPTDPMQSLIVKYSNAPYGTRILVRRPADPARFSGTVLVETMNPARGFDMAIMHGFLSEHILETNSVWVGVSMPGVHTSLKRYNPTRYAALTFANPAPATATCAAGGGGRGRGAGAGAAGAAAPAPTETRRRTDCVSKRSPRSGAGSSRTRLRIRCPVACATCFSWATPVVTSPPTSAPLDAKRAWKTGSRSTTATSRTAAAAQEL